MVGAGIAGLVTALHLARAGRDVCVLEARGVGEGTTGRSTAKVSLLHGTLWSDLLERHPLEVARAYVEANRDGFEWIQAFCDSHDVRTQQRRAATFAATPDETASVRETYRAGGLLGLDAAWVDGPLEGVPAYGSVVLADQLQLDPVELLDALVGALREAGGQLVLGARVDHVSLSAPPVVRVRVGDDVREVAAKSVVVTTNVPVLDRGLYVTRIEPQRSYALAFRTGDPVSTMMLSAGSDARSVRDAVDRTGQRLLLVGGAGHHTGRARSESQSLDRLRAWTLEHFGELEEVAAWSAQDQRSVSRIPLVGRMPGCDGAVRMATGFGKWGFTNGAAAGTALAGDVLGITGLGPPGSYLAASGSVTAWARRNVDTVVREVGDVVRAVGATLPTRGHDDQHAHSTSAADLGHARGICPHLGGLLQWNDAERSWDCPLHGSRFDEHGRVLEGPATRCARVRPVAPDDAVAPGDAAAPPDTA